MRSVLEFIQQGIPWVATAGLCLCLAIIFDNPLEPWSTLSGSDQNLWTDALDIACSAANGDADPCAALAHLTSALFNYGYTYDCMSGDSHFYSGSANILSLGAYIGQSGSMLVNCHDQAHVLSTLSRALGIETQIRVKQPFGLLRENTVVGGEVLNNPFYGNTQMYCGNRICTGNDHVDSVRRSGFVNHSFVIYDNHVYDACVGPKLGDLTEAEYLINTIEGPMAETVPIINRIEGNGYVIQ